MALSGKVGGFSPATQRSFHAAAKKINEAAKRMSGSVSLRRIGEEIMTDVKASRAGHGVPVDTGALRSTGRVEGRGTGLLSLQTVTLNFGGPAAPYALIQHENMQYHHTVGEARYLVRGMERWRPGGSQAMLAAKRNAQAGIAVARRRK